MRRLVALTCVATAAAGCGHGVVRHRTVTRTLPPLVTTGTPQPTHTVLHAFHRYAAGQAADVQAQAGVSLRVTVSRPSVSTTSLSSSHGLAPQHGYYVTFHLAIVNTGSQPVELSPPTGTRPTPAPAASSTRPSSSPATTTGHR